MGGSNVELPLWARDTPAAGLERDENSSSWYGYSTRQGERLDVVEISVVHNAPSVGLNVSHMV